MLGILGYGFAYRVLDAQYFGVPQRRRRVFVVGYLGDWRRAAAVLFERHSLQGHPAPRREARQGTAVGTLRSTDGGSDVDHGQSGQLVPICVSTGQASAEIGIGIGIGTTLNCNHEAPYIAHTLRGEGFDASEDGTGRGTPLVPVPSSIMPMNSGKDFKARQTDVAQPLMAGGPVGGNQGGDFIVQPVPFDTTQITSAANRSNPKAGDPCHPLASGAHPPAIAFSCKDHGADAGSLSHTLRAMGHGASHANAGGQVAVAYSTKLHNTASNQAGKVYEEYTTGLDRSSPPPALLTARQVRRLTPRECERLQGFPDNYTLIPVRGKPAADGPRYKALGNSMAVPVMAWIGERIEAVEQIGAQLLEPQNTEIYIPLPTHTIRRTA